MGEQQFVFHLIPASHRPPEIAYFCAYLSDDRWDDWGKFETQYFLTIFDMQGTRHDIGPTKIAEFGMESGKRRVSLPSSFTCLDNSMFSLGQSEDYYVGIRNLGDKYRHIIFTRLFDIAYDLELYKRACVEYVTSESLMRGIYESTVVGQFHRIAQGGAKLTSYNCNPPVK